jgi:alpha-ribazole phosphatase
LYYIIRHTKPDIAQGVCYGISDLALADTFEEEFAQILSVLPIEEIFSAENPLPIYSSPLQRCAILAKNLAKKMPKNNTQITTDARLQEMNFGDWEMRAWADIPENEWKIWKDDWVNTPLPNGECQKMVYDRIMACVNEIIAQNPNGAIIVTHYGGIVNILAHFFEMPLKNAFRYEFTFGAVIKITKKSTNFSDDFVKVKILKS